MKSNPWLYRAPAIGWGFFILYACLAPEDDLNTGLSIEISDKVVHFILYFAWVFLLYFGSSRGYNRDLSRKRIALYWVASISVGIGVECLQNLMNLGRTGDVLDAVANTAGAIVGVVLSRITHRFLA